MDRTGPLHHAACGRRSSSPEDSKLAAPPGWFVGAFLALASALAAGAPALVVVSITLAGGSLGLVASSLLELRRRREK